MQFNTSGYKDCIAGSTKVAKVPVPVAVPAVCDAKLQTDGRAEKAAGKGQNAVGGIKHALQGTSACTHPLSLGV